MKNFGIVVFSICFSLLSTSAVQANDHSSSLNKVLSEQSEKTKSRYQYRNPKETLEFIGVKPGMTVMEVLPGRGWYSKILIPYIGHEGTLIGADYTFEMLPKFGFYSEEDLEKRKSWVTTWTADAQSWYDKDGANVSAFVLGSMPADMQGTADVVLFIRALHNLNRFENDGGYLTTALKDAYAILKPGGTLGVVQHHAREEMPDDWAQGSKGYLKKSLVIDKMKKAGFEFVGETDINQNPKDQPTTEDIVWRLPPTYFSSRKDPSLKPQYEAIGESNRMTLKFRKPQ